MYLASRFAARRGETTSASRRSGAPCHCGSPPRQRRRCSDCAACTPPGSGPPASFGVPAGPGDVPCHAFAVQVMLFRLGRRAQPDEVTGELETSRTSCVLARRDEADRASSCVSLRGSMPWNPDYTIQIEEAFNRLPMGRDILGNRVLRELQARCLRLVVSVSRGYRPGVAVRTLCSSGRLWVRRPAASPYFPGRIRGGGSAAGSLGGCPS